MYVAFDVTATVVGHALTARNVESWWLIEEDAKTYDGNGNRPTDPVRSPSTDRRSP